MVTSADRQLDEVRTANDEWLDSLVRHQVFLLAVSGSIRNATFEILAATEREIEDLVRSLVRVGEGPTPASVRNARRLIGKIESLREEAWRQVESLWNVQLSDLLSGEIDYLDGAIKTVLPVIVETNRPSDRLVRSLIGTEAIQGALLKDRIGQLGTQDVQRLEQFVIEGLAQGRSNQEIAGRISTAFGLSRNNAFMLLRTAALTYSNAARREFLNENGHIFGIEVYVATLDSRTTAQCRALDGTRWAVGDGPQPPIHWGCRSIRVAEIDGTLVGDRPMKPTTERMLVREYASANGLGEVSRRDALPRGHKGKFDDFSRRRVRQLIGRVPAKTTYAQFLRRQSVEFQNEVLGVAKARLYRKGGLTLDRFVTRDYTRELTLKELARRERQAFIAAGLDPENFL